MLDATVTSVLELEIYLNVWRSGDKVVIVAAGRIRSNRGGARICDKLLERLERLETQFEITQVADGSAKACRDSFSRVLERLEKLEANCPEPACDHIPHYSLYHN